MGLELGFLDGTGFFLSSRRHTVSRLRRRMPGHQISAVLAQH